MEQKEMFSLILKKGIREIIKDRIATLEECEGSLKENLPTISQMCPCDKARNFGFHALCFACTGPDFSIYMEPFEADVIKIDTSKVGINVFLGQSNSIARG